MPRYVRPALLSIVGLLLIAAITVGGFKLFIRYVRARVEAAITSAEILGGIPSGPIPFRYVKGWIIVRAAINDDDREYDFIVDTGAEATCLLRSTAERCGLKPISFGGVRIGGDEESVVLLDRMRLGPVVLGGVGAVVVDDQTLEPISCLVDGGIIGINVLSQASLHLDYVGCRLILGDSATAGVGMDAIEIPFLRDEKRGLARVNLCLAGSDSIRLLVDTGFSGFLNLSLPSPSGIVASCRGDDVRRCWTGPPVGTYAKAPFVGREAWAVRLRHSAVGALRAEGVPAYVESSEGAASGLVGNGVFDRYLVTIDWTHQFLRLVPEAGRNLPTNLDILGVSHLPHGDRLIVHTVYDGSEAAVAGIAPGDEIITVNSLKIANLSREELCQLWVGEHRAVPADAESLVLGIRRATHDSTYVLRRFKVFP